MENLYIEKESVEVTVQTISNKKIEGHTYVSLSSKYHPGRETVGEVMNNEDSFIIIESIDEVIFLNKNFIKKIIVPEEEIESIEGVEIIKEEVIIEFADGEKISGKIAFSPEPNKERVSDFIQQAPDFFPVLQDGKTILINRNQVLAIKEVT